VLSPRLTDGHTCVCAHVSESASGPYNITVCNNTAWTFRSLWHGGVAVLTPTGFAQTVSNVNIQNVTGAAQQLWPPLRPISAACPVLPLAPCPPSTTEGSCSTFLGTGHGGEYVFSVVLHAPDGTTVDLLSAVPSAAQTWHGTGLVICHFSICVVLGCARVVLGCARLS
jgi:hypothetical protein